MREHARRTATRLRAHETGPDASVAMGCSKHVGSTLPPLDGVPHRPYLVWVGGDAGQEQNCRGTATLLQELVSTAGTIPYLLIVIRGAYSSISIHDSNPYRAIAFLRFPPSCSTLV